jgi:type II secretory pathway pseudopilin PulG
MGNGEVRKSNRLLHLFGLLRSLNPFQFTKPKSRNDANDFSMGQKHLPPRNDALRGGFYSQFPISYSPAFTFHISPAGEGKGKGEKEKFSLSPSPRIAFTLAEVLITLGIIGVVAALSIPALINKVNSIQTVTGVKKAYATLSGAQELLIAEYDDIASAISAASCTSKEFELAYVFKSKMNVAKNCARENLLDTGCFPDTYYKNLDNSSNLINFATNENYHTFLTTDGMAYAFYPSSTTCTSNNSGGNTSNPLYLSCGFVYVDINGPNKGPAIRGRDLFKFSITQTGIYPSGAYYDSGDGYGANCTTLGSTCTYKVLKEDAVNY